MASRIRRDFAAQLHADADVLGLDGRTDIVKAGLALLHRSAAEQRMARSVDEFYVLSVNPLNVQLGHVAVIPITGSPGPASTHVTLTADHGHAGHDGHDGHDESYADITGLQPVARGSPHLSGPLTSSHRSLSGSLAVSRAAGAGGMRLWSASDPTGASRS